MIRYGSAPKNLRRIATAFIWFSVTGLGLNFVFSVTLLKKQSTEDAASKDLFTESRQIAQEKGYGTYGLWVKEDNQEEFRGTCVFVSVTHKRQKFSLCLTADHVAECSTNKILFPHSAEEKDLPGISFVSHPLSHLSYAFPFSFFQCYDIAASVIDAPPEKCYALPICGKQSPPGLLVGYGIKGIASRVWPFLIPTINTSSQPHLPLRPFAARIARANKNLIFKPSKNCGGFGSFGDSGAPVITHEDTVVSLYAAQWSIQDVAVGACARWVSLTSKNIQSFLHAVIESHVQNLSGLKQKAYIERYLSRNNRKLKFLLWLRRCKKRWFKNDRRTQVDPHFLIA